jgi:hypothetical protein
MVVVVVVMVVVVTPSGDIKHQHHFCKICPKL